MKRLFLLVLLTGACRPVGPTRLGENGNGSFRYVCASTTDPTCDGSIYLQIFPEHIALGATFGVSFNEVAGSTNNQVQSAADALLHYQAGNFVAASSGYAGLYSLTTDGLVKDFTHVLISAPSDYLIMRDAENSALVVMNVSDEQQLFASPVDDRGFTMAGAVAMTWTSSDTDVLQLVQSSPSIRMTVVAKAAGTATLTVANGDKSRTLDITVEAP